MRHLVIPDCQVRPGDDFGFLYDLGKYIADKRPEKIICLGDFADMPSLSSYDVGKKAYEGRRYVSDIQAAEEAMMALFAPIHHYNAQQRANKKAQYHPELHLLYGNHEERINRAVNSDAKLDGVIGLSDLHYEDFGWKCYPFLDVAIIDGVAYSHYFTSGIAGRPVTTASACLSKKHQSCIQGHQQGLQIATGYRADGALLTSVIAGSFYEHDEDYLGPQGNKHWRGVIMLHEVNDGQFDIMPISLRYIRERAKK